MPRYAFSAFAADGAPVSGEVSAESEAMALDAIARRGLTPVSLSVGGAADPWWAREVAFFGAAGRVRAAELERFFATLAALLRARLPLPRAIAFCRGRARDRAMRRALDRVAEGLANGATLAQSMAEASPAFPERLVALVASGEAANRLDEIAARAAALLASEAALRRELGGALVYPAILMIMATLVLGVVVFYLAPTLLPVFTSAGTAPPQLLSALYAFGRFLAFGWPLLLALAGGAVAAGFALRRPLGAGATAVALRLPLAGRYLRKRESLRVCQALALMLDSGAPLTRAIAAARDAAALRNYRALLATAEEIVIAGGTLSQTLGASSLVDPLVRALVEAGEESDRLTEMLDAAVQALAAETAAAIAQATRLVTPILTLVIGLAVGAVILGTISAIMDLNDVAF